MRRAVALSCGYAVKHCMPKERLGKLSGIVSLWASNHLIPSMISADFRSLYQSDHFVPACPTQPPGLPDIAS